MQPEGWPTVVGINWMEAVFSTTKITMELEATPGSGFSFSSSLIAFSPKGVAALPSPRKLAAIFIRMARQAGPVGFSLGKAAA